MRPLEVAAPQDRAGRLKEGQRTGVRFRRDGVLPGVSPSPANTEDTLRTLVEMVGALQAQLTELANAEPPNRWMTTMDAAIYLGVSRDTLDRLAKEHGHGDDGPRDAGALGKRRLLRWDRTTIDDWFSRVCRIAPPPEKRENRERTSRATNHALEADAYDWSED